MREVLSCRTPGQAVPLPDRFRSLKAWLLEGLAYSPELLQCLRYYLFPPRHSSFGRWGWLCLHLCWWVRGSWGREVSWIHQCSHSLGWGESRGRALPHSLVLVPRTVPRTLVCVESMGHCWSWGFCPRRAPRMRGAGRSFEKRGARPLRPFLSQCN